MFRTKEFQVIIESLIPEHLRNNKLFTDTIDVFCEYIIEKSNISIDIKNAFNEKNKLIYNEFLKIFCENITRTLESLKNNKNLKDFLETKISKESLDKLMTLDISSVFNKETLITMSKDLYQKGKSNLFKRYFDFINSLELQGEDSSDDYYIFSEMGRLEYKIESSLYKQFFELFIKPLAHPLGYLYTYERLLTLYFRDFFSSQEIIIPKSLLVGCQDENGILYDNYLTGEGFLFENGEIKETLNLTNSKKIKSIDVNANINFIEYSIIFESNEELLYKKGSDQSLVLKNQDGSIKKDYNSLPYYWYVNLDYDSEIIISVYDEMISETETEIDNTASNLMVCNAGNLICGIPNRLNERYIHKNIETTYFNNVNHNKIREQILLGVERSRESTGDFLIIKYLKENIKNHSIKLNDDFLTFDLENDFIKINFTSIGLSLIGSERNVILIFKDDIEVDRLEFNNENLPLRRPLTINQVSLNSLNILGKNGFFASDEFEISNNSEIRSNFELKFTDEYNFDVSDIKIIEVDESKNYYSYINKQKD